MIFNRIRKNKTIIINNVEFIRLRYLMICVFYITTSHFDSYIIHKQCLKIKNINKNHEDWNHWGQWT